MVQLYRRKGPDVAITETLNGQAGGRLALLPGGGFIVVWHELGGDGSGLGVKGQRFDANGTRVGGEFLINTTTTGDQYGATVATLPSGRFVVTWTEDLSAGLGQDLEVRGRIFEADGTPVGGEFQVNTVAALEQTAPQITELASGGFVIIWVDLSESESDTGAVLLKGQLYNAGGASMGGEFLVNTPATSGAGPSVLALANGGFAVAWISGETKLQLFDAAGAKVGGVQTVSAQDTGSFQAPSVDALGSGFIVTWAQQDSPPDAPVRTFDLHAQRFDAAGNKVGAEILVNTTQAGTQTLGDSHALPGGGFLIVWQGPAAGTSDLNIYGQFFDDSGNRVGGEFIVTTTTEGNQERPKIDILPSGDIVIVFNHYVGDTANSDVRMQILTPATADSPPTDIALSDTGISEVAIENLPVATLSATMGTVFGVPTYTIVADETGGAFRIEGDRLIIADNSRLDFETNPSIDLRIRVTDSNGTFYEETLTLSIENAVTETRYAAGDEFTVNTTDDPYNYALGSAALASGGLVVLSGWGGIGTGMRVHILDAAGQPVVPERGLDLLDRGSSYQDIAGLPSGGFVVAYEGRPVDLGDGMLRSPIRAQRFDAAGNEVGPDLVVSMTNDAPVSGPQLAVLSSGAFVVTWELIKHEAGATGQPGQIMARLYGVDGQPLGSEFRVNTGIDGQQIFENVEALPNGGFVVTWSDAGKVEGQRFDAAGNKVGGEMTIATGIDLNDTSLAVLNDGSFVVAWATQLSDDEIDSFQTWVQHVGADGVNIGGPVAIAVNATFGVGTAAWIAATADGGFVATWHSLSPGGENEGIDSFARFFDASGVPIGDVILLRSEDRDYAYPAFATRLASGAVALAWTTSDEKPDGDVNSDIAARIFSPPASSVPTPGPDMLAGTAGPDFIDGLGGNDQIQGYGGDDGLLGSGGDDYLDGGEGNDSLHGGDGIDGILGNVGDDFISGGDGNDSLHGQAGVDTLIGGAGNDFLSGGEGVDVVYGGTGDDIYISDTLDYIVENAGEGFDLIYAAASYTLSFGQEIEIVSTGDFAGTNAIDLGGNELNNILWGNAAVNVLSGFSGNDSLHGFGGNDGILGGTGDDFLDGGDGDDSLFGDDGNDTLAGGAGNDFFAGGAGVDIVYGGAGNDTYIADALDYIVEAAGGGTDIVYASASFALSAGQEIETLSAGGDAGAISLTGNELANNIWGNAAANILNGGGGADVLIGYGGNDVFAFTTAAAAGNADTIADFAAGDKIALDDAVFSGIGTSGAFSVAAFVVGASAADGNDRIVYNAATGQLFYDADGNAAGAAVLIATLTGNPVLAASDFQVI